MNNIRVVIRVRPPNAQEVNKFGKHYVNSINVLDNTSLEISECMISKEHTGIRTAMTTEYTWDYVHGPESTQEEVFDKNGSMAVNAIFQGFNATIMAYGQTGAGKTYTLDGFWYDKSKADKGLISRSIEGIFDYIENGSNENYKFLVRVSFIQIYNDIISDLLKPESKSLSLYEDKKSGILIEGLSEWAVRNTCEITTLLEHGVNCRKTFATNINELSSRSHAILLVTVEQSEVLFWKGRTQISMEEYEAFKTEGYTDVEYERKYKVGKLNLVDLAGSERVSITGAVGARLEESKKINQSLSCLGNVISALVNKKSHVPYRNSKLTRLLEDSLGGNCVTTFMGMVSPSPDCYSESLSTLKFANRAKNIKNAPKVNEDLDKNALIRKYQNEIYDLKSKLNNMDKDNLNEYVSDLELQHKKVCEDRENLIKLLKNTTNMNEENIILNEMQGIESQMMVGGHNYESNDPRLQEVIALKTQQLHEEYNDRFEKLESQKRIIKEEQNQIDKYKELLLKQKDIIYKLTERLHQKDDIIDILTKKVQDHQNIEIQKNENVWAVQSMREWNLEDSIPFSNINSNSKCPSQIIKDSMVMPENLISKLNRNSDDSFQDELLDVCKSVVEGNECETDSKIIRIKKVFDKYNVQYDNKSNKLNSTTFKNNNDPNNNNSVKKYLIDRSNKLHKTSNNNINPCRQKKKSNLDSTIAMYMNERKKL